MYFLRKLVVSKSHQICPDVFFLLNSPTPINSWPGMPTPANPTTHRTLTLKPEKMNCQCRGTPSYEREHTKKTNEDRAIKVGLVKVVLHKQAKRSHYCNQWMTEEVNSLVFTSSLHWRSEESSLRVDQYWVIIWGVATNFRLGGGVNSDWGGQIQLNQNHISANSDLSSDFGHFILEILENLKI